MKTIRDYADQMDGKKVLMRVDFNVPLDKETGEITNDLRIRRAMPTIQYALDHGAAVILMSHLGRPGAERDESLSLRKVAERLDEMLEEDVQFSAEAAGPQAEAAAGKLQPGQVLMLENTRFYEGEKANNSEFSQALARLGDIYINDAFGTAHRAHASTAGVAEHLPGGVGLLIEKEVEMLSKAVDNPDHPYVAIMGGAKVSDKIQVIKNLLPKVDAMLIGGAMAYTFLKQQGKGVGESMVEDDRLDTAGELLKQAGDKIILPVDHICAREIEPDAETKVFDDEIPDGWIGLDIGPKTAEMYAEKISNAALVTWNGPMGYFEIDQFAEGTIACARAMAMCEGTSIVGGGETAEAIEQEGLQEQISHVSTGGGASLTFLGGEPLPGIEAVK
jgi:3-phosphoglycerate kinase